MPHDPQRRRPRNKQANGRLRHCCLFPVSIVSWLISRISLVSIQQGFCDIDFCTGSINRSLIHSSRHLFLQYKVVHCFTHSVVLVSVCLFVCFLLLFFFVAFALLVCLAFFFIFCLAFFPLKDHLSIFAAY